MLSNKVKTNSIPSVHQPSINITKCLKQKLSSPVKDLYMDKHTNNKFQNLIFHWHKWK